MTAQAISKAVERVRHLLDSRPQAGIHADEPAVARWQEDLRVICSHANGTQIATDLPAQLGGTGDQATPGWLMRAALASCLAARIAMEAAAEGIALARLEVTAASTSDARGLFGMTTGAGEPITAAPCEVRLTVQISAPGVPAGRLQGIVDESYRCSPVAVALVSVVPIAVHVDVDAS